MTQFDARSLIGRLAKNMSWLFLSQILIAVFGLATLIITARAVGPAAVGILALVDAYVQVLDRLCRLEPWQAVIKYGSDALTEDDTHRFGHLIKLSIVIDIIGGILAGTVAILLAPTVAPMIGLPEDIGASYIALVAIGLIFSLRPTGIAVLRIHDRFDLLAISDMVVAGLRLVGTIIVFLLDLGLWAFLALMLMHQILTGLVAFFIALRELQRRGVRAFMSLKLSTALKQNPGFLRFLWNSNFNVVLRQSTQRLDVLVVGALLDVTSVGFYQVGKRIMTNIVRIGGPIRQVLYPEMTRLWSAQKHDRFWKLVRYISMLMFGVSLAISIPLAWKMSDLAVLLFGAEFQGAAPVMTILMFAAVIYLGGLALNPALLSMGLDRALVRTTMMATGVFALSFIPLLFVLGIEGVAFAHVIFNIVWTTGCILAIRSYPAPR
ncbi:oligosaccharide flippase family protein [uncultured Ruegeria sp.]|uniref:lipopolysaccharide biosynthesis protein n=2 Tax=uncultured Ruegeria sp. TaxID=259304 RepID=UPI002628B1BF|nr:oligosaccharide flippase family protein [uncultured Ruegeria sp.]